jgi:hypothetical protein
MPVNWLTANALAVKKIIDLNLTTSIASDDYLSLLLLDVGIGATPRQARRCDRGRGQCWSESPLHMNTDAEREDQNVDKRSVTKRRRFSRYIARVRS